MPNYHKEHETEMVYTKAIEVDKKMVPIVAWLNSYENVYTLFCCEGDDEKKRSYVSFISVWNQEITEVIDVIKDFTWNAKYNKIDGICKDYIIGTGIQIEIDYEHISAINRFTIRMEPGVRDRFIKYLKDYYIDLEYGE